MAVERLGLESRPPLTVSEFKTLAEQQGWDEDTRIELLDGEVVWMSPISNPHVGCVNRLTRLYGRRYPERLAQLSIQNPFHVSESDETQPDVTLLRPRPDDYGTATATPADILLLVEVADHTLRTDLGLKARIYANGGVAEYWVVDLNTQTLHVHRAPTAGVYATHLRLTVEDRIGAEFARAFHLPLPSCSASSG